MNIKIVTGSPSRSIRPWRRLLPSLVLLAAFVSPAPAQSQTGSIEGRVQNEVTGMYLNNTRVAIKGTDIRTQTDETGRFILTNVPGGMVTLEVLFSGLEKREIMVTVAPGQRVRQDVKLVPLGASTVQMDPFQVASSKITDQAVIAINEQRFSPNLKTVVATGDLSEHADGNIAEFLKFVPGLSGNLGQRGDIGELSVRGFPSIYTQITTDGMDEANAPLSGNSRSVSLRATASISNLARVEVLKVPRPSDGADTMAGSVNLVSRSAFEAPRRQFRYTATLSGEHNRGLENLIKGEKTYSLWDNKKTHYAWPGFSFTYADPVSDKFGYTISGKYHKIGLPTHERSKGFQTREDRFGSSIEEPVLTSASHNWWGQMQIRHHLNATADWKMTPNSVLSAGARMFNSSSMNGIYRTSWSTGNNDTSRIEGGIDGSYGPTYTIGATGRGSARIFNNTQIRFNQGYGGNLRYKFDNGDWRVDLKTSRSGQDFRYRTLPSHGGFRNLTIRTNDVLPLRVEFHDIEPTFGPRTTLFFNNDNEEVDVSTAEFWLNNSEVQSATMLTFDVSDDVSTYNADIRKELDFFAFPAALQVGGAHKTKDRRTWNRNNFFLEYNGPGGDLAPLPEFLTAPVAIFPGTDGERQVSSDPYGAAAAYNNDPSLFFEPDTGRNNRKFRRLRENIQRDERIKEDVDAFYLQAEARFFENRLNVLTGVRYEKTSVDGLGALNKPSGVYQRNADGSFVVDGDGDRVRIPEAGGELTVEELPFTWFRHGARAQRSYDGYYPSVHLTYNFTEKLQSRAAYAKTYGRPNFRDIIPLITVNEFTAEDEVTVVGGRLNLRNPGLLPWEADNYDLTTEYYTDQGGVLSAGVFRKDVVNFFSNVDRESTPQELAEAGVENALDGEWETRTTINFGSATVNGVELAFNQSLAPLDPWLAGWGKYFRVFANYTKIRISGEDAANFTGFQPRTANWGVQFARKRARISLRWNSTAERITGIYSNYNPGGVNFAPPITHLDINASYGILPNLDVFIHMKNVAREIRVQGRRGDNLPEYAWTRNQSRQYGISTILGIRGSF